MGELDGTLGDSTELELDLSDDGGNHGADPSDNIDSINNDDEDSSNPQEDAADSYDEWLKKQEEGEGKTEEDKETHKEDGKEEKETPQEPIKIKVDGQEIDVPMEKVPAMLQKAVGAEKRMQEAAAIRNETKEFIAWAKENPIDLLQKLGHDVDAIAEQRVYEKIMYDQMSPEQQEAFQIKKRSDEQERELAKYKEQEARALKEREEAQKVEAQKAEQQKYFNQYQVQIPKALEIGKIKNTPENIRLMVSSLREELKVNPNTTPYDVLPQVKAQVNELKDRARKARVKEHEENDSYRMNTRSQQNTNNQVQSKRPRRLTSVMQLLE